jgi:hypothetical protein
MILENCNVRSDDFQDYFVGSRIINYRVEEALEEGRANDAQELLAYYSLIYKLSDLPSFSQAKLLQEKSPENKLFSYAEHAGRYHNPANTETLITTLVLMHPIRGNCLSRSHLRTLFQAPSSQ